MQHTVTPTEQLTLLRLLTLARPSTACKVTMKLAISGINTAKLCERSLIPDYIPYLTQSNMILHGFKVVVRKKNIIIQLPFNSGDERNVCLFSSQPARPDLTLAHKSND